MLDNLTYKQRINLVVGAFFLVLILIYILNFKKTIQLYSEVSRQEKEIADVASYPAKIRAYSAKVGKLNALIDNFVKSKTFGQEEILGEVASFSKSNHIKIRQFPVSTLEKRGEIAIETYSFVVDGRFADLVRMVDYLERRKKVGKVTSVTFEKIKERRTKRIKLYATIYLQNIRK